VDLLVGRCLRGVRSAAFICMLLASCTPARPHVEPSPDASVSASSFAPPSPYLSDARFRRGALEASLENPANDYSVLRLAHYDTGTAGDWSRLPEWNPRVEPVAAAELEAPRGASRPVPLSASARPVDTQASPLEVGEEAFFRYPVQLALATVALTSRAAAERYGLWIDDARGVGGLVRAQMADGSTAVAFTCATCHARPGPSGLVAGAANDRFDLGRMLVEGSRAVAADVAQSSVAWGPGRADVTTPTGIEPVRISDLRPTRWLTHLQHGGAVRQKDLVSLAIRIETLIVTSHNMVLRPPRAITLALATYVWSLAGSLPSSAPSTPAERKGAGLFESECARCHAGEGLSGGPVPFAEVGTDATLGRSGARGTGGYRVPSLRGVGSRSMLLHDASLASVDAVLDPARLEAGYAAGRRPGPVKGHVFGLDLRATDRAALVAFLRTR
jgi:cytochrome c5